MSFVIRAAGKIADVLPPRISARLMLALGSLLPVVSSRHRQRFNLIDRLAGPEYTLRFGPFAGMRYFRYARGSHILPKFAGTYERELFAPVQEILGLGPDVVVDIGSAEGYYVVGLARRLPGAAVLAYDVDRVANDFCRRLAQANGVQDRVQIRGLCTPEGLERDLAGRQRPLVICDVEGFEDRLLVPEQTPSLKRSYLIVELHEGENPGVGQRVRERFAATHAIQTIPQEPRVASMLAMEAGLTEAEALQAMDEGRQTRQDWLVLRPRQSGSESGN